MGDKLDDGFHQNWFVNGSREKSMHMPFVVSVCMETTSEDPESIDLQLVPNTIDRANRNLSGRRLFEFAA